MSVDGNVRLVGDRLEVREFDADDADAVQAYAGDPVVTRFLEWGPNSIEDTQTFLAKAIAKAADPARSAFDLAIVHAESGVVIGSVAIAVSGGRHPREGAFGYVLHRDFWSQGYATEAAGLIMRFGFDQLNLRRLSATCHPDNRASARVLRKVGLLYQGRVRNHLYVQGSWRDSLLYAAVNRNL